MTDLLGKERRSELMRRVKSESTGPEVRIRHALHRRGLRYKICDRSLPGTPDLSFPRWHAVLFVHGCFWHGHECPRGKQPSSNLDYWIPKLRANKERDRQAHERLSSLGWRVYTVWECELRRDSDLDDLARRLVKLIRR